MPTTTEIQAAIKAHRQKMTDMYAGIDTTISRLTHVQKKTKKRVTIDILATKDRIIERLKRNAVVIDAYPNPDSIHVVLMVHADGRYRFAHGIYPFSDRYMQPQYKLSVTLSNIIVTIHAIERFMERNDTLDVDKAVAVLGNATHLLNNRLAQMSGEVPVGAHERQVSTSDGGIAIIKVNNIEEGYFQHMDWTVVTYISPDMVRDFNAAYEASEFEGEYRQLEDRDMGKVVFGQPNFDAFR